ncbi:DUF1203 domain-containing protein [Ramlibacter humi]|uniref:DUF1203 domain-containing protein n=1 Tax=Ramlibacter humi TaxID=2530451 RepID=A0A4Z0CBS8_9BURK|nr:DUF1203 domain-containing protein [Ramlibacter humi]TFZ07595.1 DUF1203 domain-containing protein [Ramlibacter humi]
MADTFQLQGLDPAFFQPLFALDDGELRSRGIVRRFADAADTYPCRVSLGEAALGEELLLLPFEHQPASSPYRASGPIFVRRGVPLADLAPGELPPYVTKRVISLRAYDDAHMIVDASVAEGADIGREIRRLLGRADTAYLHLHNAKRGCYSCKAVRA